MDASMPDSRKLYESQAQEQRNADGWHYADELATRGPALVRAADYLVRRADTEQSAHTERARVALARSSSGLRGAVPASPPAPPAPNAPVPGRSRS
ncbi:hypothetical protein [Streptomyces cinereoruber]|uniref:hypothetical protein n=1 Tax=Streptomyces cinereoruber TaxID=67260 RepID=UPI003629802F